MLENHWQSDSADSQDTTDSAIIRKRFRRWMVAALIFLNVFAAWAVIFSLKELYERDIRQVEIQSQNLSLAMSTALSNEVEKIDITIKTVISEIKHHTIVDSAGQKIVSQSVQQHKAHLPGTDAITVTDAKGRILLHHGVPSTPSFDVSDRAYFRKLQSGEIKGLLVTEPIKSRITGEYVLLFARARYDRSGRFDGIVGVPLPITYFEKLFSGFDVGQRGVMTLRSADLSLIVRIAPSYEKNRSEVGARRLTSPFVELVQAQKHVGTYHATIPFDQVERIVSFRLLDVVPIYVLAAIAKQDYLADWRKVCWGASALLLAFLFITNISGYLLYRQWSRQRRYASRLQESLMQIHERDAALVSAQEAGGLGTYTLDLSSGTWTSSAKLDAILGIDETYPRTFESWVSLLRDEEKEPLLKYFYDDVVQKRSFLDREYQIVRPCDGQTCWVHSLGKLEFDAQGNPIRISGTIQDISGRKLNEAQLQLAREVFQSAVEGIFVTDKEGTIIEVNAAFTTITGYSAEEAIGQNPRILKSGMHQEDFYGMMWEILLRTGKWEGEFVNKRKDGSTYIQYSRLSTLFDNGEPVLFTALITDITELKESQMEIEYLAYYDKLTGLANRTLLADRMRQAVSQCQRKNELLGVCYIDLDGFKPINDEFGHQVGDQLLVEVGKRLQRNVRTGDTVARMGGDEFVILLSGNREQKEIEAVVLRIIESQTQPYSLGSAIASLSMSVGVTIYPFDAAEDADTLIRHADQAMYEAKRQGKNRMQFYDLESDRRFHEHQQQYARIKEGFAQGEFCLHYQPKVNIRTGAVTGVEALIRWEHPEEGLLPPHRFLTVIEGSEMALQVGEWVLHEAMRQRQHWQSMGITLCVSVNLFALHLQQTDFAENLAHILNAYPDLNPNGLELEILETTAMENLEQISSRINECRQLGVRFSLDDFGTGYSSLTYLRELPVDIVKIDRSFVIDMLDDQDDQALVEGIVGMARTLKRQVIAEGVETLEHGISLLRYGCDVAQGYGIAKPMPAGALAHWLANWKLPDLWKTPPTH